MTLESDLRLFGALAPIAERLFARSAEAQISRHMAVLAALVEGVR